MMQAVLSLLNVLGGGKSGQHREAYHMKVWDSPPRRGRQTVPQKIGSPDGHRQGDSEKVE
jgi:hypothetical protein